MKTIVSNSQLVWANSSSTPIYHPLTPPVPAKDVKTARVTIELNKKTGNLQVQTYYEYSYDGFTWTRASSGGGDPLLGAAISSDTISYGSTFQSLSSEDAEFLVRFGAAALLTSGSTLAVGYVTIELDVRNA
jgi:hypothetical protein